MSAVATTEGEYFVEWHPMTTTRSRSAPCLIFNDDAGDKDQPVPPIDTKTMYVHLNSTLLYSQGIGSL